MKSDFLCDCLLGGIILGLTLCICILQAEIHDLKKDNTEHYSNEVLFGQTLITQKHVTDAQFEMINARLR